MPDSQNSGNKIGPPKEMSMEMRLLLALVLTVPILFLGPYLFGPQTPPTPAKKTAGQSNPASNQPNQAPPSNPAAQTSASGPKPGAAASAAPSNAKAAPGTPQELLPSVVIDTNLYHIVFTNYGANVETWLLKKYNGNDGKPLDLANTLRPKAASVLNQAAVDANAAVKQAVEAAQKNGGISAPDAAQTLADCGSIAAANDSIAKIIAAGSDASWDADLPKIRAIIQQIGGLSLLRRDAGARFNDAAIGSAVTALGSAVGSLNQSLRLAPFSLSILRDSDMEYKVNWSYYTQAADPDGLGVTYKFSDGHVAVEKKFRFERNSYLSHVSTDVTQDGVRVPHGIEWRGGFGDLTVANPSAAERAAYYDKLASGFLGLTQGSLVEKGPTDASKGALQSAGPHLFAGVTDTYFAAVFLPSNADFQPANEDAMRETIFTDYAPAPADAKRVPFPGIAVSDGGSNQFRLFVGPKDVDLLKRIDPKLEQLVNFGWMAVVAKPLFLIVNWANDNIVHSFGWSIILVTIVLNLALFPLRITSMKSMRKMQALKPQIDAINAKYKGLSVRDPKAADKTQETMDLYKKHGVNPMGGCLPMVLQLPILIAFYQVFRNAVEMRGAHWLWVTDLSQPETIPIHLLPLIMIATQFLSQKMMPQPGADPAQQRMTMFMPLIFGFMFYNLQSGLVLYYLTSNLVGVGLQWFFNKTDTARLVAQSVEPPPKKKPGKK